MDKSEMKRAYKQTERSKGVYRIKNVRTGIVYIGFAADLPARINRHRAELTFGSHRNRELQEIWDSFGESALEFEIIDELDYGETPPANPTEELRVLAEMWVQKLKQAGETIVYLKSG